MRQSLSSREYKAALKRRGSLMVWLDADLQWRAPASGRSGRSTVFSDAAIQFCLTLKSMFGLGLRQATGLAESLISGVPADQGHMRPEQAWRTRRLRHVLFAQRSKQKRSAESWITAKKISETRYTSGFWMRSDPPPVENPQGAA
nr:transposase [Variovorax boronicumulans]